MWTWEEEWGLAKYELSTILKNSKNSKKIEKKKIKIFPEKF